MSVLPVYIYIRLRNLNAYDKIALKKKNVYLKVSVRASGIRQPSLMDRIN